MLLRRTCNTDGGLDGPHPIDHRIGWTLLVEHRPEPDLCTNKFKRPDTVTSSIRPKKLFSGQRKKPMSLSKIGEFDPAVKSVANFIADLPENQRNFVLENCDSDELRTFCDQFVKNTRKIAEPIEITQQFTPQIETSEAKNWTKYVKKSPILQKIDANLRKFEPSNRSESRKSGQISRKKSREIAQKRAERERRYFNRLSARYTLGQCPEKIEFDLWEMGQRIIGDTSGRAAEIYLERAKNRNAVAAIRNALGNGGVVEDLRDRRIVALGLLIEKKARWAIARTEFNQVMRGIPETAMLRYLHQPGRPPDELPSLSALNGIHRTCAEVGSYHLGYLRALQWSGLFWREQPKKCDAPTIETMGAYALNVYHVIGPTACCTDSGDSLTEADWLAFRQPSEQSLVDEPERNTEHPRVDKPPDHIDTG